MKTTFTISRDPLAPAKKSKGLASGDPAPSAPDLRVTRQLRDSAKTMNIELVEHVIGGGHLPTHWA